MENLDHLREELLDGQLDRRAFVRKALALGISLPAAAALLSAWDRTAGAARLATPKRGGTLKFARNFEPVTPGRSARRTTGRSGRS
jgi:hypothetical protein